MSRRGKYSFKGAMAKLRFLCVVLLCLCQNTDSKLSILRKMLFNYEHTTRKEDPDW